MPVSTLLDAAARAFATVSLADGTVSPAEEHRFARFAAGDPALKAIPQSDVRLAWLQAVKDVKGFPSIGWGLLAIEQAAPSEEDKATVMRAAQAAVVADGKLEPQENAAVRALAEALKLDPETF